MREHHLIREVSEWRRLRAVALHEQGWPELLVMVPEFLWHGAEAYGFRGNVWTCPRIAQVIRWELGVSYHKDHVSRLMKELGWTPQIPITRAVQRDEEA